MDGEIGKKRHSTTAMFLLFTEGCTLLLVSAAILTCGFVLDMHSSYDTELIDSIVDYTQYWVGFVFLITAFCIAAAAVRQRNRTLIVIVVTLLLVCLLVSLFALVVEGNDWVYFNNARRTRDFWEDKDYTCATVASSCTCQAGTAAEIITVDAECGDINKFSNIYGGIVCCTLIGVFVALSTIVVILILIPIKHLTLPEPKPDMRNITVVEKRPKTPPSPKIVYQHRPQKPRPKPQPQVIVKKVERPPPPPQVIVKEVERTPPPPRVIVKEVERAPPPPRVIVKHVERPPPPPKVIVKEVERAPPPPRVIVKEVERPPPPPKVIVKEVERPPPPPKVIIKEVQRPPPPPKVIVKEVQRPPPPPQVIVREVERPPPPPQMIVREVEPPRPNRQRSIVYNEPVPRPQLMAIEGPPFKQSQRPNQKMISHVYDEGRLVSHPRPRPQPQPVLIEGDFVRNPNFGRPMPTEEPIYVPRQRVVTEPVKPKGEWVVDPVRRSRKSTKPHGAYMVVEEPARHVRHRAVSADRRPRERVEQEVIIQRARAYSDERPRTHTTSRPQMFGPTVITGRYRSNSYDGGSQKPRVYTDRERQEFYDQHGGEAPRVENVQVGNTDRIAGLPTYDLEDNMQPAAEWTARPPTPY